MNHNGEKEGYGILTKTNGDIYEVHSLWLGLSFNLIIVSSKHNLIVSDLGTLPSISAVLSKFVSPIFCKYFLKSSKLFISIDGPILVCLNNKWIFV